MSGTANYEEPSESGGVIYLTPADELGPDAEICGTCYRLRATVNCCWRQRCDCDEVRDPEELWRPNDFPKAAELCYCCGSQLLRSGSRWSVWFCRGCLRKVQALNASVGRCVVPIGRHSLMNGVGVAPAEVEIPFSLELFTRDVCGLFDTMKWLHTWAAKVTERNLPVVGFDPTRSIPLDRYLQLAHYHEELASERSFDRLFAGLCESIGQR